MLVNSTYQLAIFIYIKHIYVPAIGVTITIYTDDPVSKPVYIAMPIVNDNGELVAMLDVNENSRLVCKISQS